jgi:hypothetical protein
VPRHLDDDVERRRHVVDDPKPDPLVVHPGGDVVVRTRRLEQSGGMVVDEHLSPPRETRQREDASDVAPRDDARRLDHALVIDRADEADLAPARERDRRPHGGGGGSSKAVFDCRLGRGSGGGHP